MQARHFRPFDINRVRFSSRTCFPALGALASPVHNPPPNKEYHFRELDLILVIIRQKTDDDLNYIILVDNGDTLTNRFMAGEWAESISEMLDETFYDCLGLQCAFSPERVDARPNRNKMFANESRYALARPYTTNN